MNNKRSWFNNKKCFLCHKQGTMFRYFDHKHQQIICDNKHCDIISRVKAGYFGGIQINKGDK